MLWKELAAILFILLAVVIFGNLWFHFVESILAALKRPFTRRKSPPVWHPLPKEKDQSEDP